MENKFKLRTEKEKTNGATASTVTTAPGPSIFSGIERKLKLESYFEEGFPIEYLPKILFVVLLILLYISNTHHADKTTRQIDKMRSEVEDLRADYTTLKADVMFSSKQSEVARRVKSMGLNESLRPPFKIVVENGEY
ncbi:MAG TPA: FtsL-like putative cell division protein [Cyclobacteriaceae bacterium]|jgi:hypothetical protein|nr:FtsL-like putative cell division protein [Cyclobacteriaceae bacterium]